MLKDFVAEAKLWGNWDAALNGVVSNLRSEIDLGFEPRRYIVKGGEAPLWTAQQWRMVLERITTAKDLAVLVSEIENELEGKGSIGQGSEILLSMVKYNLLALRPSTLARDLPVKVYGDYVEDVVTLPLPAHVWAAKAMLKKIGGLRGQRFRSFS
jgi:hypothetical protein